MATSGPFLPVKAPLAPAPSLSLLTLGREVRSTPEESRWESGFVFTPETCFGGEVLEVCPPSAIAKRVDLRPQPRPIFPVGLQATDECSTFGLKAQDYEGRAMRLLGRSLPKLAEAELWTGALGGWGAAALGNQPFDFVLQNIWTAPGYNPTLASPQAYIINGGAGTSIGPTLAATQLLVDANIATAEASVMTAKAGLASLEAGLGDCGTGAFGMIHASRDLVSVWFSDGLIHRRDDGVLVTALGNIVVPGAGYSGAAPPTSADIALNRPYHVPAPGTAWAYATGMVLWRQGSEDVIGGIGQSMTDTSPSSCLALGAPIALNVPVTLVMEDISGGGDYRWTFNDLAATDQLQALFDCVDPGGASVLVFEFLDTATGEVYSWEVGAWDTTLFSPMYTPVSGPLHFTQSYSPPSNPGPCGEFAPAAEAEALRFLANHGGAPGPTPAITGTLLRAYCASQGAASGSTNTVRTTAERIFAAYHDECCLVAALVDGC